MFSDINQSKMPLLSAKKNLNNCFLDVYMYKSTYIVRAKRNHSIIEPAILFRHKNRYLFRLVSERGFLMEITGSEKSLFGKGVILYTSYIYDV